MAGGKSTKRDGISDMERRFAAEYLIDLNATEAYMRAALPRKVSRKTAGTNGWKTLQRPEVQALVVANRDEAVSRAGLTVDETLQQLRRLLMYDVRKLYSPEGAPLHITELSDDMAAAIVGVEVVTKGNELIGFGEVTKYKLADKVATLEKAMKYHNLFKEDYKGQADALKEVVLKFVDAGKR
ncbi:MAG: terminase small subunit [Sulfuritalea sp.]|jgi:phage terminase small subunit|nr:terminase small subunit [Sulfuritalea sp.]